MEMALTVLTVGLAGAGAGLWVWRAPMPEPAVASVAEVPAAAASSASTLTDRAAFGDDDARIIVSENIFSSTRAAPRVRYTPPGAGDAAGVASMDDPVPTEMIIEAPLPQVFGTMTGPGGATALIQPDSAGASGRLYREGEKVGEYRIIQITSGSVVVRGPGGRHELKVQSRDRSQ